jgi:hypothetical protein
MTRNAHPVAEPTSEQRDDGSYRILDALLELDATSERRAVTVERLRVEKVPVSNIRKTLEQLVNSGLVSRVEYRTPTGRRFRDSCQPTAPIQYKTARYWIETRSI